MGPVGDEQPQQFPFDSVETVTYSEARLAHLAHLFPDLKNKSVLELGAGVGNMTYFFEDRGCRVISVDGRKDLCEENLRRHPKRHNKVVQLDVTVPTLVKRLGRFDVVFCYGLLYHVHVPSQLIEEMANVCDGLLLIETLVDPNDVGGENIIPESADIDQSLWGMGCRPNRRWIVEQMLEHMPFVYQPRTCPKYGQFITQFPSGYETPRAMFAGSRDPLPETKFHDARQELLNEVTREW